MSAVEMLKLGREIKSIPATEILVYHFDFKNLTWGSVPDKVEFVIDKDPLGTGRGGGGFDKHLKPLAKPKVLTTRHGS